MLIIDVLVTQIHVMNEKYIILASITQYSFYDQLRCIIQNICIIGSRLKKLKNFISINNHDNNSHVH